MSDVIPVTYDSTKGRNYAEAGMAPPFHGSGTVESPGPAPDEPPTGPVLDLPTLIQRLSAAERRNVELEATIKAQEGEINWLRGQLARTWT